MVERLRHADHELLRMSPNPPRFSSPPTHVYFYPAAGQTTEQQERDRFDCYLWAVNRLWLRPQSTSSSRKQAPRSCVHAAIRTRHGGRCLQRRHAGRGGFAPTRLRRRRAGRRHPRRTGRCRLRYGTPGPDPSRPATPLPARRTELRPDRATCQRLPTRHGPPAWKGVAIPCIDAYGHARHEENSMTSLRTPGTRLFLILLMSLGVSGTLAEPPKRDGQRGDAPRVDTPRRDDFGRGAPRQDDARRDHSPRIPPAGTHRRPDWNPATSSTTATATTGITRRAARSSTGCRITPSPFRIATRVTTSTARMIPPRRLTLHRRRATHRPGHLFFATLLHHPVGRRCALLLRR